jgi:hypothetical protein
MHLLRAVLVVSLLSAGWRDGRAQAAVDTARPRIPTTWRERLDSTFTVAEDSTREVLYYRNRFVVSFDDSTSGASVWRFLHRYRARIVGGFPELPPSGGYVISIPDPGPTLKAVKAMEAQMAAEPGVDLLWVLSYRDHPEMRAAAGSD